MFEPEARILVLLATYNGELHLYEQINSIQAQSFVAVSTAVSDDCSVDGTQQILKNFSLNNNNRLNILPAQRCGSAAANFFRLIRDVKFSDVDYVAFSDQDDVWCEDKLSHAVKSIVQNNVDAYSSNVTAFWSDGRKKIINKAQPQQQWDYMFESAGPGCTFVLTQKFALDLQHFLITNQNKCQQVALHDWFIYAFARSRGFNWFIDNESHMLYRQHSENVVGANVGIKAKWTRWKKLRECWFIRQALLIADILEYSNTWPISRLKRFSFVDRLVLIINIKKLRRRVRDRIALTLFLLLPLRK